MTALVPQPPSVPREPSGRPKGHLDSPQASLNKSEASLSENVCMQPSLGGSQGLKLSYMASGVHHQMSQPFLNIVNMLADEDTAMVLSKSSALRNSLKTSARSRSSPRKGQSTSPRHLSTAASASDATSPPRTPAGFDIVSCVELLKSTKTSIEALNAMGCFGDDDEEKRKKAEKVMSEMKLDAAKSLSFLDQGYSPRSSNDSETLTEFFAALIEETDIPIGNKELVEAFLTKVRLNFSAIICERELLSVVVGSNSMCYLESLLKHINLLDMDDDGIIEIFNCAVFSQECRIPLTLTLLQNDAYRSRLEKSVELLQETWEEFFVDICNAEKTFGSEDRTGRLKLVKLMLTNGGAFKAPCLSTEGEEDGQTIFTRACRQGQGDLVDLFLFTRSVKDINQYIGNGASTPLIEAVRSNNPHCVKAVLEHPGVVVNQTTPDGNAFTVCKFQHNGAEHIPHSQILKMLTAAKAKIREGYKQGKKYKAPAAPSSASSTPRQASNPRPRSQSTVSPAATPKLPSIDAHRKKGVSASPAQTLNNRLRNHVIQKK